MSTESEKPELSKSELQKIQSAIEQTTENQERELNATYTPGAFQAARTAYQAANCARRSCNKETKDLSELAEAAESSELRQTLEDLKNTPWAQSSLSLKDLDTVKGKLAAPKSEPRTSRRKKL